MMAMSSCSVRGQSEMDMSRSALANAKAALSRRKLDRDKKED
jgi:hypothetical protein